MTLPRDWMNRKDDMPTPTEGWGAKVWIQTITILICAAIALFGAGKFLLWLLAR